MRQSISIKCPMLCLGASKRQPSKTVPCKILSPKPNVKMQTCQIPSHHSPNDPWVSTVSYRNASEERSGRDVVFPRRISSSCHFPSLPFLPVHPPLCFSIPIRCNGCLADHFPGSLKLKPGIRLNSSTRPIPAQTVSAVPNRSVPYSSRRPGIQAPSRPYPYQIAVHA